MSAQVLREVSWGEGLVVAAFRSDGGLKAAVQRIHDAVGPHIGNRNTFAKFLRVDDPSTLRDRDRFRAWLLLTALNEEATEWGIPNSVVPSAFDLDDLISLCANRDLNPEPADSEPIRPALLLISERRPTVVIPLPMRSETTEPVAVSGRAFQLLQGGAA